MMNEFKVSGFERRTKPLYTLGCPEVIAQTFRISPESSIPLHRTQPLVLRVGRVRADPISDLCRSSSMVLPLLPLVRELSSEVIPSVRHLKSSRPKWCRLAKVPTEAWTMRAMVDNEVHLVKRRVQPLQALVFEVEVEVHSSETISISSRGGTEEPYLSLASIATRSRAKVKRGLPRPTSVSPR